MSSPVSTQKRQPSRPPQLELGFPGFYDTVVVTTRLVNGTLGIIDGCCPVGYGYDARAEVLGTAGVLFIGELREHPLWCAAHGKMAW